MIQRFIVLLLLSVPASTLAQQTQPARAQTLPAIEGYEGEARKLLEQAFARYRSARTYEDKLSIKTEIDAEGESPLQAVPPQEVSLAFARPNKIALVTGQYAVHSDGRELWQAFTPIEQYLVTTAPAELDLGKLELSRVEAFQGLRPHPILRILTEPALAPPELLGNVSKFAGVRAETVGGQAGRTIIAETQNPESPAVGPKVLVEAWLSDKTGLIGEIRFDHTAMLQARLAAMGTNVKLKKYLRRMRFEGAQVNAAIPDSRFKFQPGPYEQKVARYELPTREEYQQKLVGRPAPDFTAKDLNGKTVKLAELKGRVVLLDFWATWCGPCMMILPEIQKLSQKYADKPVTVLGVNGDKAEARQKVVDFVRENQFTYPHLLDTDDSIYEAYRAMAIPHLVLIDKKGTIRLVEAGVRPGTEWPIPAEVEKLLKEPGPTSGPSSVPPGRASK